MSAVSFKAAKINYKHHNKILNNFSAQITPNLPA